MAVTIEDSKKFSHFFEQLKQETFIVTDNKHESYQNELKSLSLKCVANGVWGVGIFAVDGNAQRLLKYCKRGAALKFDKLTVRPHDPSKDNSNVHFSLLFDNHSSVSIADADRDRSTGFAELLCNPSLSAMFHSYKGNGVLMVMDSEGVHVKVRASGKWRVFFETAGKTELIHKGEVICLKDLTVVPCFNDSVDPEGNGFVPPLYLFHGDIIKFNSSQTLTVKE
ncbi:hypothetical protein QR680_000707 [Steinernema hermaphroditum]|uniref:Uncharacterized protein n=1 Tax=Steinernema hermaphroditum TaxID=289476 RepID=A0AA39GVL0_9BILA|nr:hypothetical protein QR680_000707 [Steinernema hermaphroditum]